METIGSIPGLRDRLGRWRQEDRRIALVPTMGNLHRGHLALVEAALEAADRVVVSLFVNPLQFGPGEDYERYPRTLAADREALEGIGAHLLFAPAEAELYPHGREEHTRVEVPGLSDILCGASRPGHFAGVATVVAKLFGIVQPDLALFGEKDYQQLLVIRRLVRDLCLPLEVLGRPTVREADGLALSSRNLYLTVEERRRAPALYRALSRAARDLAEGREPTTVEARGLADLRAAGLRPDYFAVRRAADLNPPGPDDRDLRVLAAAYLGGARLIDNLPARRP